MSVAISTDRLTFADLCNLEPRLLGLRAYAEGIAAVENQKGNRRCRARPFYRDIKPRLVQLIGHHRLPADPVLSSTAAYNAAYHTLYTLMPACRECACYSPA